MGPIAPVYLQSWTKGVETLHEKDLFRKRGSFSDSLSPFQCCRHVKVCTERIATLKRRGGLAMDKKDVLKLRKDADRKRLFCSNKCVNTFFHDCG